MNEAPPADADARTPTRSQVRAFIRDAQVDVRVGLHPWERHPERPARLLVSVEMTAALPDRQPSASRFMNYDPIRAALREWPSRPHTGLLEDLADELVALCLRDPAVETVRVSLVKPDIFNDVAGVGIEVVRTRANAP